MDQNLSPLVWLQKSILSFNVPLSTEELDQFLGIWKPYVAKRKEILSYADQTEQYLYFVTEGVQRIYYYDDAQREATLLFTYAPSFGGILDSLMLQQPSKYFYETLTASHFLRAHQSDLHHLMQSSPSFNTLVRQSMTMALSGVLERLAELQCFSSEEKFKSLLRRSPHILQRIPHKYLANYIGVDPTNFSKMMNKVKI